MVTMRRAVFLVGLLALAAVAQIGGYFKLGPVPNSVVEGHKFTVTVKLETSARQDFKLAIETVNMSAPAELVIPKGSKVGSFEVVVSSVKTTSRTAPRVVVGRLTVSSSKYRAGRDITILPRNSR